MSIIFFLKYASALKGVYDNDQRTVNITKLKPAKSDNDKYGKFNKLYPFIIQSKLYTYKF